MIETAIPMTHSLLDQVSFIQEAEIPNSEKNVADLATHPGWEQLEKEMKTEIERLSVVEIAETETVEQYGFKVLAASLCRRKLEWVINRVRSTESAVRESTGA